MEMAGASNITGLYGENNDSKIQNCIAVEECHVPTKILIVFDSHDEEPQTRCCC
jgi:hypothetical protein